MAVGEGKTNHTSHNQPTIPQPPSPPTPPPHHHHHEPYPLPHLSVTPLRELICHADSNGSIKERAKMRSAKW